MRALKLSIVILAIAAVAGAQSPLTTLFTNNSGGSVGGAVYFDLIVGNGGVTVTALDVNLTSTSGTPGSVLLWTRPGESSAGREGSAAGWSLAGSGLVTAAGQDLPSRATLTASAPLAAGRWGIAMVYLGVAPGTTIGTGGNQTFSNNQLTLVAGSSTTVAFSGTATSPRVWNGAIHYTNGGGSGNTAWTRKEGRGCVDGRVSYYEDFLSGAFDLSNTSMTLIPNTGGGYAVVQGNAAFVPPTVTGLGLTDDSVSPPLNLPFTLVYPGGTTTQIRVCSNGFIYLNGTGTSTDYTPTVAELLSGGPRLFAFWTDLLPDGGTNTNNCFFEVDTVNGRVIVTWLNVPEYANAGTSNTCQIIIGQSGVIDLIWQTCNTRTHPSMTGFSPGANNLDPGNRDLSTSLPFVTTADAIPLDQDGGRPLLGGNMNLLVSNIPSGAIAGLELIGTGVPGGIDLTAAGMPGCWLYVTNIFVTLPFNASGTNATVPLSIPNNSALVGGRLPTQAIVVRPGINAFGAVTSNQATLIVGNL